ncbi:MAG: dephospho-CoA kinase [Ahniella sp.]|nr:dephospho-CoA kinase [Ahniella sp.]
MSGRTYAITGGIASGKSAACARFEARGVRVFDADVIARELVAPGQPALDEIVATFGADVLDGEGRLDRRRMRERVFHDVVDKRRLEAILHPRVRTALRAAAEASTDPYCLLAIPLLVESGQYGWVDGVIVVDVSEATQVERVMRRDRIDEGLARQMLAAQSSRQARLAIATFVLDNNGTLADLHEQVDALHARLSVSV